MKIAVAFKVVPDDQDIQISADQSLDFSKAPQIVSTYDLNAIEAAIRLIENDDGSVVAMTVGGTIIDDSKLKKNVLARGVDELFMIADDACADMDAYATAQALAVLSEKIAGIDVILCGDGSADNYAQQVDVQLAATLDLPYVNAVTKITRSGENLEVERTLEDVIETVEVSLPAVISVTPDIALPRIPGMKDILAAGKKPMNVTGADSPATSVIEVIECRAPEQTDRKREIFEATDEGAIAGFVAAIKAVV